MEVTVVGRRRLGAALVGQPAADLAPTPTRVFAAQHQHQLFKEIRGALGAVVRPPGPVGQARGAFLPMLSQPL